MSRYTDRRTFLAAAAAGALLPLAARAQAPAPTGGLTLAQIRQSGELRIGVEAAYPPFTFRREGQIVGYDVDLAEIFCRTLGVRPTIIDTSWSGVIPSLYSRKFEIVMSAMTYTPERLKRVRFSVPYAEASQAMLVRSGDNSIKSPMDLDGKVVAVKLGSPGQVLQERLNTALKAKGGAGFKELKIFDDHPAAYMSLGQGKADVVFNTVPTLAMVLKDAPGRFAIVKGIGADNWAGIAARNEDPEIVQFLDSEIARLKADGTLARLSEKWLGFRMQLADRIPALT